MQVGTLFVFERKLYFERKPGTAKAACAKLCKTARRVSKGKAPLHLHVRLANGGGSSLEVNSDRFYCNLFILFGAQSGD